ncbi:MAG: 2-oxoglutarate ferredoxin oxidoreductase subunit gamma [Clostridia bacterium]|jgi:2-oxoglutarate ferredoxin oxidoreductase subunit gamma|nr:2-oxoglutarate ferredoxin oxidoreductase subunit gamma [Clostridia bacterium]
MGKYEVRLSGSGGQGLLLAGIILAEAAIIEGKNAVQTQSYGPEARGGASKSEVLISEDVIDFPKVRICDILLSLTQKSYEEYNEGLKDGGMLIIDNSVEIEEGTKYKIYSMPIIDTAVDVLGKPMVTNIVALGAIVGVTKIVSTSALEAAVLKRVPKGTEDLNRKALTLGFEMAEKALGK